MAWKECHYISSYTGGCNIEEVKKNPGIRLELGNDMFCCIADSGSGGGRYSHR